MATAAAISQTDDRRFRDWFLWFPVNWNWFVVAKVQNSQHHQYITHTHTHSRAQGSFLCSTNSTHTIFTHNANCWATNHISELCSHHIFSVWRRACFRFYEHCLSNLLILVFFFLIFARSPSINAFSRHSFCGLYKRLWAVVTYIESQVKKEQHRTGENVIW